MPIGSENTEKCRIYDQNQSLGALAACEAMETDYFDVAWKSILTELMLLEKDRFQESVTIALLFTHTSFPLKSRCSEEENSWYIKMRSLNYPLVFL